jgi:hypothetical protein
MSSPLHTTSDHERHHPKTVTVHVNEHPVVVPSPKTTGLEIKEAAIQAGLPVDREFVLSEERKQGPKIIGDADPVHVDDDSHFLMVPPDDNS